MLLWRTLVHKSGICNLENVSSTNTLLTDKKSCSEHLFGTHCEKCLLKTKKRGMANKIGGLENFQKSTSERGWNLSA